MLTGENLLHKFYDYALLFQNYIASQKWHQAKYCYDTARNVAVFLELEQKQMEELFGSRQDEENIITGRFREEDVQKVYYECAVKRDGGRTKK